MCISRCFIQGIAVGRFGVPIKRNSSATILRNSETVSWIFEEFGSIDAKHMSISDRVKICLWFTPANNLKLGGIMQDKIRMS